MVLVSFGPLAIKDTLEDAFVNEPIELVAENVARSAETLLELLEVTHTRNASRTIRSVQRSPTISSVLAIEQF